MNKSVSILVRIFFMVAGGWQLTGCGKSVDRDFKAALPLEARVGEIFAELIRTRGDAAGEVVVLTNAQASSRMQQVDATRLQGIRKGLPGVPVREISVGAEEDPRSAMMMNDLLPIELLEEALGNAQGVSAVISLVGVPYASTPSPHLPPLYVFGLSRQDIARQAVNSGMAAAVLHSRGTDDTFSGGRSPIAPELLESYALEVL